jgi:hypothetical protein
MPNTECRIRSETRGSKLGRGSFAPPRPPRLCVRFPPPALKPAPFALFAVFCSPSAHRCVHENARSCEDLKTRLRSPDLPRQPNATICNNVLSRRVRGRRGASKNRPGGPNQNNVERFGRERSAKPCIFRDFRNDLEVSVPTARGRLRRSRHTRAYNQCSTIQQIATFEN